MKQFIIIIVTIFFVSCSSKKNVILYKSPDISHKEYELIFNNSSFSTASIVGGGAKIIEAERSRLRNEKIKEREKKLKKIDDVDILSFIDEEGNTQFKAIIKNDILFAFDSYELSDRAKFILLDIYEVLSTIPGVKIKILGHTDNIGEKDYNLILSLNRAKAVSNFLYDNGFSMYNMIEEGKGYLEPVASNDTPEGREKNRRVEIIILSNDE